MIFCADVLREPSVDIVVRACRRSGCRLAGKVVAQRCCVTDRTSELEASAKQLDVGGVRQVLRVDDGVNEGVRGVDIETSLTIEWSENESPSNMQRNAPERPLQSDLDPNSRIAGSRTEQDLNVAQLGHQKRLTGVVNRLVARDDCAICAGNKGRSGRAESRGDGVRKGLGFVRPKELSDIDVGCSGVDVRHECRLATSDLNR